MLHAVKPCEIQTGGFCFENTRSSGVQLVRVRIQSSRGQKDRDHHSRDSFQDDMVVADKNCMKIHYIAPNIYCCGAGVAADADVTTQIMSSNVELHMLNTGRPALGQIGASLIVGGVDVTGPQLYSLEEAKQLVREAITAGIFCDLGSGSNVDLCIITEAGVEMLRGYDKPAVKGKREGQYRYKPGTTAVLTKTVTPFPLVVVDESVQIMDTE
ncbi:hypothetical protein F7725_015182 [Dissostichus mawsoni]|uniref:Proteasome beta subunit C-terminal domain-containing protein n=1 Tax=Dissostichus mawsoni TaxID=36200 RepID=A0A7J5YGV3_DISMA|nr:hypothetical protein F7725_015182 [Dissostichus mawsoni]